MKYLLGTDIGASETKTIPTDQKACMGEVNTWQALVLS